MRSRRLSFLLRTASFLNSLQASLIILSNSTPEVWFKLSVKASRLTPASCRSSSFVPLGELTVHVPIVLAHAFNRLPSQANTSFWSVERQFIPTAWEEAQPPGARQPGTVYKKWTERPLPLIVSNRKYSKNSYSIVRINTCFSFRFIHTICTNFSFFVGIKIHFQPHPFQNFQTYTHG